MFGIAFFFPVIAFWPIKYAEVVEYNKLKEEEFTHKMKRMA